jgi:uncharacterized protein YjbJ (UPF0337 family)
MNRDILKGKWMQIRGDVKKTWGNLTDDDLARIDGNKDKLVGMLVEKYGYSRERAQQEVDRFDKDVVTRYNDETDMHNRHA